jgi:hypothetical protein
MNDRKIVDYKIANIYYGGEEIVKKLIDDGYQPYGALVIYNKDIFQVMVKYEEVEG